MHQLLKEGAICCKGTRKWVIMGIGRIQICGECCKPIPPPPLLLASTSVCIRSSSLQAVFHGAMFYMKQSLHTDSMLANMCRNRIHGKDHYFVCNSGFYSALSVTMALHCRYSLALYLSISKVQWDENSLPGQWSGTAVDSSSKLGTFSIDTAKISEYDAVNQLWDCLDSLR
jgi:hypothetical protein